MRRRIVKRGGRLHVGCGPAAFEGWINIDMERFDGVDYRIDVRKGLPFEQLDYVYAEHFIEHLRYEEALRFLRECRRVLEPAGVLRLTTPNLDWVWTTHYHLGQWTQAEQPVSDCFRINKAFRGWGHEFVYNLPTLTESLLEAGFETVECCGYGESRHDALRDIEQHEKYGDSPALPHIIIVEASGRTSAPRITRNDDRDDFLLNTAHPQHRGVLRSLKHLLRRVAARLS